MHRRAPARRRHAQDYPFRDTDNESRKRSSDFYKKALGWKIKQWGKESYWMVTTGKDGEPGINGGIMPKKDLKSTVNTVGVASVDKALKKVVAAGGKVVRPKIAITAMGWLAYCSVLDGNAFGVMEMDGKALRDLHGAPAAPRDGAPNHRPFVSSDAEVHRMPDPAFIRYDVAAKHPFLYGANTKERRPRPLVE